MEIFKGQKYDKLRKHHQELGVPWTDPTFSPSDTSIGHTKRDQLPRNVKWKRPHELCEKPKLFVDGISHHDATQGKLGNCWFVAACSVLAGSKVMWSKVIPDCEDQEYGSGQEYSGVFRFRFWRFGKWVEVLVDDLLPATEDGELLFTHSSNNTEFWSALLEKAYAKLHGCYAVLDGGNLSDALVDFTSGISEVIDLDKVGPDLRSDSDAKKAFFETMNKEIKDHALMCCAIQAKSAEEMEKKTDLGLVKGHAYGITAVREISLGKTSLSTLFTGREKLSLVRLQNPWGAKEWTGSFGDKSTEWNNVTEKEREKLGLTLGDDGEFWMPFDDFLTQFTEMSICRVINTSLFSFAKTWEEAQMYGSWTTGADKLNRAGGCLNHPETFLMNPQYRFDIDTSKPDETKEVIIQLSQSDTRAVAIEQKENLVIGFCLLKVEANRKYRLHQMTNLGSGEDMIKSDYIKTKHIFIRTSLTGGRYACIVTTFNPGETTDFLLRIFTEDDANVKLMDKDEPGIKWWQCCAKPYQLQTRITVQGAKGLENQDVFGKADPYCIVKCEGKVVKSLAVPDSQNPTWETSCLFYRKDPTKPVKIQVWNKNLVLDTFIGQSTVAAAPTKGDAVIERLSLGGRRRKKDEKVPGEVTVKLETYDDLSVL